MTDSATTHESPDRHADRGPAHGAPGREVIVERHVATTGAPAAPAAAAPVRPVERRSSVLPFIAGFVTAVVAGAIGIVAFLAISDSDDDGRLDLEVPAVDVDVDGG